MSGPFGGSVYGGLFFGAVGLNASGAPGGAFGSAAFGSNPYGFTGAEDSGPSPPQIPEQLGEATGWQASIQFGQAIAPLPQFVSAQALEPGAAFGNPSIPVFYSAQSLPAQTRFGIAAFPVNLSLEQAGSAPSIIFGDPWALQPFLVGQNWQLQSQGFRPTGFGQPEAFGLRNLPAQGTQFGVYGAPKVRLLQEVVSLWDLPEFGAGRAAHGLRAAGFRVSAWGLGRVALGYLARSLNPTRRFGRRPSARNSRINHRSFSWRPVRFGRARGARIFGFRAAGEAKAQMGAAHALVSFRALHTAPESRFGRAIITRTPAC